MTNMDENCKVCKKGDKEDFLMLCDGCDHAYHSFCVRGCTCCNEKPKGILKLAPVPEGDFYCKFCDGQFQFTRGKKKSSTYYAFGNNASYQLGGGDVKDEIVYSAVKMTVDVPISCLAAGEQFTMIGTTFGEVYSIGDGSEGKLGHGDVVHEVLPKFRRIEALDAENVSMSEGPIQQLIAGPEFSFAITSEYQVYSWGNGEMGQLGHQDNKNKKVPKKISAFRQLEIPVTKIVAGEQFVLMTSGEPDDTDQFNVDKPGVFMAMGANTDGQLGDKSSRNQWVPQFLNKNAAEHTVMPEKSEIDVPYDFELGRDIAGIAAGRGHAVALTASGQVWSWGLGQSGQLGHAIPAPPQGSSAFFRNQFRVGRPMFIQALRDVAIKSIACGVAFTMAITDNGKLLAWGSNEFGQMEKAEDVKQQEFPNAIPSLEDKQINKIATGAEHVLALTNTGQVFAWGNCAHGQLGIGEIQKDNKCIRKATEVEGMPTIKSIVCGPINSFCFPSIAARATKELAIKPPSKKKQRKQ